MSQPSWIFITARVWPSLASTSRGSKGALVRSSTAQSARPSRRARSSSGTTSRRRALPTMSRTPGRASFSPSCWATHPATTMSACGFLRAAWRTYFRDFFSPVAVTMQVLTT